MGTYTNFLVNVLFLVHAALFIFFVLIKTVINGIIV